MVKLFPKNERVKIGSQENMKIIQIKNELKNCKNMSFLNNLKHR